MEPNPSNPYQAPQSEITVPTSSGALASPWIRLGAAIIDGLILLPINWILQKILLKMPTAADLMSAAQEAAQSGRPMEMKNLMPGTGSLILVSVLGFAVFLAVNYTFLKNGQTVGKKLLKLQVQRRSDSAALPIQDYLLKRLGPIYAVSFIAVLVHPLINLALLVDALCIFRPGRNTLHDDIAGSKVVQFTA
jgi:uncharacterized RDD family membrane protein YckC